MVESGAEYEERCDKIMPAEKKAPPKERLPKLQGRELFILKEAYARGGPEPEKIIRSDPDEAPTLFRLHKSLVVQGDNPYLEEVEEELPKHEEAAKAKMEKWADGLLTRFAAGGTLEPHEERAVLNRALRLKHADEFARGTRKHPDDAPFYTNILFGEMQHKLVARALMPKIIAPLIRHKLLAAFKVSGGGGNGLKLVPLNPNARHDENTVYLIPSGKRDLVKALLKPK
ncbi:MAG: hypothetical protein V1835_00685 [Candidatus Micrarchaeota archaeon]